MEVCSETEWVISDPNGIYDLEMYAGRSEVVVLCMVIWPRSIGGPWSREIDVQGRVCISQGSGRKQATHSDQHNVWGV